MMNNLISLFGFFNQITNTIITCIIILTIVIGIILMLKYPASRKVMLYVFAIVIIFVGSLSGYGFYKDITTKSYVFGDLDYEKLTNQQSMMFSKSHISFYVDSSSNNDCYFESTMPFVDDFNGMEHDYIVYLNDYVLTDTTINAGSIYSVLNIAFYDTEYNLVCDSQLNISILFLSNKTKIRLETTLEDKPYLEEYFSNNGFTLKIIDKI